MTLKEIDEKIKELEKQKEEIKEAEKKKLQEQKDKRLEEVKNAEETYNNLLNAYISDYGCYHSTLKHDDRFLFDDLFNAIFK